MARADLADRCVLVTGATGMAAAASRALARAGAQVFLISRTPAHLEALAAEVRAEGGRCAWQAADLGDEGQVEAAFAALDRACGRLDAAFGAAGISGRRFGDGPLHAVTSAGWETVLRSNTTSQFLVARAALRRMLAQPPDPSGIRGSILLMSSTLAMHPAAGFFGTHAYAASKGAIEGLTRALAAYYAPSGIRVNAIAPGLVATPMSWRAQTDPAVASYLVDKQPLAQGAIAADAVAATVVHLLGDGARMITGQVVAVDAGWSVSEPRPSADQPPS